MNKELLEENDRNIRLFGIETQKKLFETKVLLINLTPALTELAKNLILSGTKLILYDDETIVTENDINNNFFLNSEDLNKNKSNSLKIKLNLIKSSANIDIIKYEELKNLTDNICFAGFDITNINKNYLGDVENLLTNKKIFTYYIYIHNKYGFFINNLFYNKQEEKNINKKEEKIELLDDDEEENQKDKKENEEILLEDEDEELEKFDLKNDYTIHNLFESLNKKINEPSLNLIPVENKIKHLILPFSFYNYYMEDKLTLKFDFKDKYIDLNENKNSNEDEIYYFPTSCVIGGIVCQEIVNLIGQKKKPNCNLYSYDAFEEIGEFFSI